VTHPLIDPKNMSPSTALREQLDEAKAEASRRWQAFDKERKRLIEGGKASSAEGLRELEELHGAYKRSAAECDELTERFLESIDSKLRAMGTSAAAASGKAQPPTPLRSIGDEFWKKLGPGGSKALEGTSGGTMVAPFYDPNIRNLPQRALFVRTVIPTVAADSDKVWFLRQSVATQNAAPVAAGALKPTSVYTVERIEQPVTTVAHITEPLDRALLSDQAELTAFLDNQLRLGVLLAEENQIINGNGTPPNLKGILNTAGILTQARGTDNNVVAIYKAITLLRQSFFEPTAIVLNPTQWQNIRVTQDANGNFMTAPLIEADPDRLFGFPVITSPVISAGTGLVGAFDVGAQVWDREEARVTFTESGALAAGSTELFSRNQIVFRAEERLSFGTIRPSAFATVTSMN
jgi:HK97 family phage major capsid protein